jgi:hypothetical protein
MRGPEGPSTEVALPRERAIRAVLATTPLEPRAGPPSRSLEFDLTDVDVGAGDREDRGSPHGHDAHTHEPHGHEAHAMLAT